MNSTIGNFKTLSYMNQEKRRKRGFHDPRAAGPFKEFAKHLKMTEVAAAREVLNHPHEYPPARLAQAKMIAESGKMAVKKKHDLKSNPPKSDAGTDPNADQNENPNMQPDPKDGV